MERFDWSVIREPDGRTKIYCAGVTQIDVRTADGTFSTPGDALFLTGRTQPVWVRFHREGKVSAWNVVAAPSTASFSKASSSLFETGV